MLKTFKKWLKSQNKSKKMMFKPGHFYSPIVEPDLIAQQEHRIWNKQPEEKIQDVNLNISGQLALLKQIGKYYKELPFSDSPSDGLRYYYENEYYSYTDAITLFSIIRHFNPKQIVEIGSGFSSALMLDVNESLFGGSIKLSFIDPNPERLNSLLANDDKSKTSILVDKVQEVELSVFEKLNAGDILFIDSSHVVKTGSDVNHILFNILPIVKAGVLIHFHDIFFPFEYPKNWVMQGRNWNEVYFLRAFLSNNSDYQIIFFSDFLHKFYKENFKAMPLCYKNTGGNLWLTKKS